MAHERELTMRGIGIDAVDIDRFRSVLQRRPNIRQRLFTSGELDTVSTQKDDAASLAARFAVREATMKALGVGLGAFRFHDVSVERLESGAPSLVVAGRAAELARERGITRWHVSITHTDTMAMAVVAAL